MEIVALKAMVHVIKQETREALDCLSQTLTLAEPEGHIRLFVDEGAPMISLLTLLLTKRPSSISTDAINVILSAFPQSAITNVPYGGALTDSELRALRLLATEREISEIAEELSVSISTVRTYAKRIYSKLDAHSRAEAVYRARELKLL
jgi:LuxR family maltose regulon positive regulatory protein